MYPMGRVTQVESNEMGEVIAEKVFKGDTREMAYRHASSLMLLLPLAEIQPMEASETASDLTSVNTGARPQSTRDAALGCRARLTQLN